MLLYNKLIKNSFLAIVFFTVNLIYLSAYSQTNIDSISGRFQQLSKQLADLEKYVYNNEKQSNVSNGAGQQKRIDALENAVKELRGIIEVDLSSLKKEVDKINTKMSELNSLDSSKNTFSGNIDAKIEQDLLALNDKIRLIDSRFNSTVDLIGQSEIRIMRLESLIKNQTFIEKESQGNNFSTDDNINPQKNELSSNNNLPQGEPAKNTGDVKVSKNDSQTLGLLSVDKNEVDLSDQNILPEGSPEEQFKFSLDLALKRKYDEAELALKEFMEIHPNHEKQKDAHFWYGGVMFKQKKYEDAAFSDIDFNDKYPEDPRTIDTTLRIAQAMSHVANPDQACAVFENSLNFIVDPPERFVRKINELKADKACD